MATTPNPTTKLSDTLPPLVFGSATFNYQFNVDPYALNPNIIVERALSQGVRAFDTSPYYGPAEEILGTALSIDHIKTTYPRQTYHILTKVGRISSDTFDYSPKWVRYSVDRSCKRLHTTYLDVVFCHDVEFVSPSEVLEAVRELRKIRDESSAASSSTNSTRKVKYIGISGYPVDVLCDLAELILRETGEPIDVVQSYANFTAQNRRLLSRGVHRFKNAGVDVVLNASPLGMGLLRKQGVPVGAMGNWHPAPNELRTACARASDYTQNHGGEKLETVALRFAMEEWLKQGAELGSRGDPLPPSSSSFPAPESLAKTAVQLPKQRRGVTIIGVSRVEEIDEAMRLWRSVLDGLSDPKETETNTTGEEGTSSSSSSSSTTTTAAVPGDGQEWDLQRRQKVRYLASKIPEIIGDEVMNFAWASPGAGYVNQRKVFGELPDDG